MKIVYLESASQDISWFRHYYQTVFPAGRDNARTALKALQNLLAANPYVGRPSDDRPMVREFPIKRTPFIIVYRVTDERIEVLRLWDTRQGGNH